MQAGGGGVRLHARVLHRGHDQMEVHVLTKVMEGVRVQRYPLHAKDKDRGFFTCFIGVPRDCHPASDSTQPETYATLKSLSPEP